MLFDYMHYNKKLGCVCEGLFPWFGDSAPRLWFLSADWVLAELGVARPRQALAYLGCWEGAGRAPSCSFQRLCSPLLATGVDAPTKVVGLTPPLVIFRNTCTCPIPVRRHNIFFWLVFRPP